MVYYDDSELRSFIKGMERTAEIIDEERADYIVAPMMGAVPFIDVMNIVYPAFDPERVKYMPASSRIGEDVSYLVRLWFEKFLDDIKPSERINIVIPDEVVGGGSLTKNIKAVSLAVSSRKKALAHGDIGKFYSAVSTRDEKLAGEINALLDYEYTFDINGLLRAKEMNREIYNERGKQITDALKRYYSDFINVRYVGIQDKKRKGRRNKEYIKLVDNDVVIPVDVDRIITLDRSELCPARYTIRRRPIGQKEYIKYLPSVSEIVITDEYRDFLHAISGMVGKDPDTTETVNTLKLFECSRYLEGSPYLQEQGF